MILTVYKRSDGAYMLIPSGSRAFMQIDEMHGPLILCTHITENDLESQLLSEKVLADIEQHSYSMINEVIGKYFIGLTCDEAPSGTCAETGAHLGTTS